MIEKTFGNRLQTARKKASMTQAEVAKVLNITQTTLSKYERGTLEPNIDTLRRLIESATKIIKNANDSEPDVSYLVELAEKEIFNVGKTRRTTELLNRFY